jgi:hypothetical protein
MEVQKLKENQEIRRQGLKGDIFALKNFARTCLHKTDEINALIWFERAAELGDADAQFTVAELYLAGGGLRSVDVEKARKWYTKSASQGNHNARDALACLPPAPVVEVEEVSSQQPAVVAENPVKETDVKVEVKDVEVSFQEQQEKGQKPSTAVATSSEGNVDVQPDIKTPTEGTEIPPPPPTTTTEKERETRYSSCLVS